MKIPINASPQSSIGGMQPLYGPSVPNYSSFYLCPKSNFSNFVQIYRKMHQHLQYQISFNVFNGPAKSPYSVYKIELCCSDSDLKFKLEIGAKASTTTN